jgi:hypothetical protein
MDNQKESNAINASVALQSTQVNNNTTTKNRTSKKKTKIDYCDVCWRKDGSHNMILQTCCVCNVSVHNQCYGIEGDEFLVKKHDWICWACDSVGLTIKTRDVDPVTNQRLCIKINERPTECVLCNVDDKDDWFHAMHPLYDSCSMRARQIVIPADIVRVAQNTTTTDIQRPIRLAWVHTLCAYAVNNAFSMQGTIYGCTQDGDYGVDDDFKDSYEIEDDDDDKRSINSYLADEKVKDDLVIHHFVFDGPIPYIYQSSSSSSSAVRTRKIGTTWHDQIISDFQKLKCHICGSDDSGSLRVPGKLNSYSRLEFLTFLSRSSMQLLLSPR